uniref:C40 family peptidase n=1 Tax=Clostridium estertheticum TaxID=238834 RepID=UPI0035C81535
MIKFKRFRYILLTSILTIGILEITTAKLFAATLTNNTYTVKSGDSLSLIAQAHGESLNDLMKANNKWDDLIIAGQILNVSIKSNHNIHKTVRNEGSTYLTDQVEQEKIRNSVVFTSNPILEYASSFLGVPYVWGGISPEGFDCSGFTQYVFSHFGVTLPRVSQEQQNVGKLISRDDLQPGDLVFFGTPAHHVGIYVGNGKMIDAPHSGAVIRIQSLNSDFTYGRRVN